MDPNREELAIIVKNRILELQKNGTFKFSDNVQVIPDNEDPVKFHITVDVPPDWIFLSDSEVASLQNYLDNRTDSGMHRQFRRLLAEVRYWRSYEHRSNFPSKMTFIQNTPKQVKCRNCMDTRKVLEDHDGRSGYGECKDCKAD